MDAQVIVQGTLRLDGTLELDEKLSLPPGRVQVAVLPLSEAPQPARFWKLMGSIWADLQVIGRTPRTRGEIDAEIHAFREEAEKEMQAVERLQAECRRGREGA